MHDPTDTQLVLSARARDNDAYKVLVGRYQGHVYGLAYSLLGDWAEAQDIAQETFIRAYSNLDQLREPGRFAAWLRRVTFSVAMNWLKAFRPGRFEQLDGRVDLDHLDVPDFQPSPAELAARAYDDEVDTLRPALERAPICTDPEARRLEMVGRGLREFAADAVRGAKACDLRAVECLEAALASIPME